MSFQIFLDLDIFFYRLDKHNLLTDNTLKKIIQNVLVRFSGMVSDHNAKLAGHFQNLVRTMCVDRLLFPALCTLRG